MVKKSGKLHSGRGNLFQLGSCSEGWLKLKSSLEKPCDKCQRTQYHTEFASWHVNFVLFLLSLVLSTPTHHHHHRKLFYMKERYQESHIWYVSFTEGSHHLKKTEKFGKNSQLGLNPTPPRIIQNFLNFRTF